MNRILIVFAFLFSYVDLSAEDCYPRKTSSSLVYDQVGLLSKGQISRLNERLINISNTTSNQIVIVIAKSLCGTSESEYAINLGHDWGVGQAKEDNGVVIVIMPNAPVGKRKTFIATGYGVEHVLADATCKLIVDNELNPRLKKGKIYEGFISVLDVIEPILKKEYNQENYVNKTHKRGIGIFGILILIIAIVLISRMVQTKNYASHNGMDFWTAFWLGSAFGGWGGSGRSGGWNDFNSGGGGFGGFGGGGFGGGGAGGDW